MELRAAGGGDEEVVGILALCQLGRSRGRGWRLAPGGSAGPWSPWCRRPRGRSRRTSSPGVGTSTRSSTRRARASAQRRPVHPRRSRTSARRSSSCCHLRWAASSSSSVHGRISTCSSDDRGTGTPVTGFDAMRVLQRANGIRIWPRSAHAEHGTFRHRPTLMSHCNRVQSPHRAHHCLAFRYQALRGRQSGTSSSGHRHCAAHTVGPQRVAVPGRRQDRTVDRPADRVGADPNPHIEHDASVGAHPDHEPGR